MSEKYNEILDKRKEQLVLGIKKLKHFDHHVKFFSSQFCELMSGVIVDINGIVTKDSLKDDCFSENVREICLLDALEFVSECMTLVQDDGKEYKCYQKKGLTLETKFCQDRQSVDLVYDAHRMGRFIKPHENNCQRFYFQDVDFMNYVKSASGYIEPDTAALMTSWYHSGKYNYGAENDCQYMSISGHVDYLNADEQRTKAFRYLKSFLIENYVDTPCDNPFFTTKTALKKIAKDFLDFQDSVGCAYNWAEDDNQLYDLQQDLFMMLHNVHVKNMRIEPFIVGYVWDVEFLLETIRVDEELYNVADKVGKLSLVRNPDWQQNTFIYQDEAALNLIHDYIQSQLADDNGYNIQELARIEYALIAMYGEAYNDPEEPAYEFKEKM